MPENETILVKKLHWNVRVFPGGKRWWDHLADQNTTSTKHDFTWTEETRVFFFWSTPIYFRLFVSPDQFQPSPPDQNSFYKKQYTLPSNQCLFWQKHALSFFKKLKKSLNFSTKIYTIVVFPCYSLYPRYSDAAVSKGKLGLSKRASDELPRRRWQNKTFYIYFYQNLSKYDEILFNRSANGDFFS